MNSSKVKYTQTEIGRIPKEWEIVRLKGISEINKESIDPAKEFPDHKFLYIDIDSVENETGVIRNAKEIIGKSSPSRARRLIHQNDVLMSTVRPYLKAFTIVPKKFNKQICSTGFAVLTCGEKLLPLFLLYSLFAKSVLDQCKKMMVGGQYPALTASQVSNIEVLIPPLPEQQKIAEILSTVDQGIEKVNEAIKKTQRLKNGLMQELLTKGIGHKEFKETEVGRIPKEWIFEVAEKVCSRVTDGTHDTPKPSENGYYLVTSKDIKEGGINFSQTYLISEDDFNEINRRSKVDSYDVLFSMIGTVGQTAIVKDNYPKFAIKNVGLFKTNNSKVLARWLHYYFGSKFAQFYIKNSTKGTTQKYLPLFSLRSFPITVAPLPEQQKITEILSEVDKRLELLREKKGKLEKIKKGLMNDLLTGRKRVRLEA